MDAIEQDRIRRAAFSITGAFEGGKGYANYQNIDSGIVSYGRFQFTLAAGSLARVLNNFLAASTSDTASQLRATYLSRVQARDATLREDETFKALLVKAAEEQSMQDAQDKVVVDSYWTPSQDSCNSRGVITPLGQALLFDMAIQHGPAHKHTQTAEAQLGVAPKSHMPENGLNEQQLIAKVAEVRRDFLYGFADLNKMPGVKKRADFWVEIVARGDWQLQGDANGDALVYGKPVQVRNPVGAPIALVAPVAQPVAPMPVTPQPPPVAPLVPAPTSPISVPPTTGEVGQPIVGTYVSNRVLSVHQSPDLNSNLLGRVVEGKSMPVSRQFMPSADEEWLLADSGWLPRRLPSNPGEVFGDLTTG